MKTEKSNSNIAVVDRRAWVMKEYQKGRLPSAVYKDWQELNTGLTKASFDMDVHLVYEELKAFADQNKEAVITRHFNYLHDMYAEARERGMLETATKILKEIRETLGIGGTKKPNTEINLQTNNIKLPDMSIDEIKSLLSGTKTDSIIDITPTE